jgi:hypothetical protein
MRTIWTARAGQVTAKYGEHAPMAAVCCNACRVCVQTNLLAVATAGVMGATYAVACFARRVIAKPG